MRSSNTPSGWQGASGELHSQAICESAYTQHALASVTHSHRVLFLILFKYMFLTLSLSFLIGNPFQAPFEPEPPP